MPIWYMKTADKLGFINLRRETQLIIFKKTNYIKFIYWYLQDCYNEADY